MSWPSPNDYNETIQSPRSAFEDVALRLCVPECNQLGLPRPRSGAFAVAYKLQSQAKNWAVKCFTRQPPEDSQQRYSAIGAYLSQQHCPYMVDFTYLQRGIRVQSQWYPVVKMEWVDGDPLHVYVQKNLGNPRVLTRLAVQWVEMVQILQRAHIAHGDLQHGNVLVVNSTLKLVDYDGMFVPTLAGKHSPELGQPNYQHPRRSELDFGPYLDNFSGWVIYVSLVVLSIYPNLWQTYRGGDDCLLFRRKDFEDPDHSGLMKTLERSRNQQLRDLVECFKIALYSAPSDVPTFDNVAPLASVPLEQGAPPSVPSWLDDHVVFKPARSMPIPEIPSPSDPSWVLDFIAPPGPPLEFSANVIWTRTLLYVCFLGSLTAILLGWITLGLILAFGLAGVLFACFRRYRSEPVVDSRLQSSASVREAERELKSARDAVEAVEVRKRGLQSAEAEQVAKLTKEIEGVVSDENRQRDSASRVLQHATASGLREKQRLDQQEAAELKQLQNTLGVNVSSFVQQLSQLQQAEATERATTLKTKQEQHIQSRLQSLLLTPGAIPGIGAYVVNNLLASGIRTAADCINLNYRKIASVGPRRVSAILAWRQSWENTAKRTMPTALSPIEDSGITAKYAPSRTQIQSQLANAQLLLATHQASIQQKYAAARIPFDAQIATEKAKHGADFQRILTDSKRRQESLQDAILRAHQNAKQAISETEKPFDALRKAAQTAQWHLAKARLENGRFRSITFGRYMRNVAIGR